MIKKFTQYLQENQLLESHLNDFIGFACNHLGIKGAPKIELLQDRDENMTTASYCPQTQHVKVYAKGRAHFDIARSIAHELVHHQQQQDGEELDGETGSECENKANSVAGQIIRLYGKHNPNFYLK